MLRGSAWQHTTSEGGVVGGQMQPSQAQAHAACMEHSLIGWLPVVMLRIQGGWMDGCLWSCCGSRAADRMAACGHAADPGRLDGWMPGAMHICQV